MPAVALTDRDGLYGAARFVAACEREGIRPILGASLTVRERGHDAPLVLLAQDERGYANLCRLITDAHMLGERGDPSITATQVCAHAAGSRRASPARVRTRAGSPSAVSPTRPRRRSIRFREAFGRDRLWVAAEHRMERGSNAEIRSMLRLAERAEVRAVATQPRPLPRARGRVPRRRARVHASDRADRREPRLPQRTPKGG